jgi:hypothetical protein
MAPVLRHFAGATAAAHDLSRIRLTIEPATNLGIGARRRQGDFYVNVRMLDSQNLIAIVAHELAHYVLGHEGPLRRATACARPSSRGSRSRRPRAAVRGDRTDGAPPRAPRVDGDA